MHTALIIALFLVAVFIARIQSMKKGKLRLAWSSTNGGKPQVTYMDPVALGKYLKSRAGETVEITTADAATRIKLRFHFGDNTGYSEIEISGRPEKIAIVRKHVANVFGIIEPTVAHE